jgi:FkbM family methyltransferase
VQFRYAPPGAAPATPIDLEGYSDTDAITREIGARSLFFEIDLLEHIYLSVPRHGLFLDVGANIGNHSVYFARFCADHVVAVEPHPAIVPFLKRNLETNAPGGYTLFPVAVAATAGVGRMTLPPNYAANIGGSQVKLLSAGPSDRAGTVQVTTLDDLLDRLAVRFAELPLTLVKIDVEGMELDVLRGRTPPPGSAPATPGDRAGPPKRRGRRSGHSSEVRATAIPASASAGLPPITSSIPSATPCPRTGPFGVTRRSRCSRR